MLTASPNRVVNALGAAMEMSTPPRVGSETACSMSALLTPELSQFCRKDSRKNARIPAGTMCFLNWWPIMHAA